MRFDIPVLSVMHDKHDQAALAASIVQWIQGNVEPRLRSALLDQIQNGQRIEIGRCAVDLAGFGHVSPLTQHATMFPWSRFRMAHVGPAAIDILLTTDDPERGEYGFPIRRSMMNAVLLPELMNAVAAMPH